MAPEVVALGVTPSVSATGGRAMNSWWTIFVFIAMVWGGLFLARTDGWIWVFFLIGGLFFISDVRRMTGSRNGYIGSVGTVLIVLAFIFAGWRVGLGSILGAFAATMLANQFVIGSLTWPMRGRRK